MATNQAFPVYILPLADPAATLERVGGKGVSLARLFAAGLPVPDGFHVTTAAYERFLIENGLQEGIEAALAQVDANKPASLEAASAVIRALFAPANMPPDVASAIAQAYASLVGQNPAVAVRSSATAEDLPGASFAGQQETYLNIHGTTEVLEAVKRCWASLWTARAIGYRLRQGIDQGSVSLAVVVQALVPAEAAGVVFTADPLSGRQDQMVINAAWGLGETVVSGSVTPDLIVVDKQSGQVIRRETANKQVMTVRTNGTTEEQPVPESLRGVPVVNNAQATELCRLGAEIERLYGRPMDIEWALAGGRIAIVQARPITGLPDMGVPAPNEWQLPDPKGRYMRTSIIDLMPDPLSPLFATMGISIYNESMRRMLAGIIDVKESSLPEGLTVTIHDYAYMKVNFSAREWLALIKLVPRMKGLITKGPTHFREVALPAYEERIRGLREMAPEQMTAAEIWRDARELTVAAMDHLSILQVDTLGAAAGSEGLFTLIYNKYFRQEADSEAATFLMGYDSVPIRAEKSLYDLAHRALAQPTLSQYLLKTDSPAIAEALSGAATPAGPATEVWAAWKRQVEDHLNSFGYILYDVDFSRPIPAENPTPQIETLKMYMRGEGANPHQRQEESERGRKQATRHLQERARGLRGWGVRKALGWAQALAEVREDSIASIGLAYPRLRDLLKELGRRMAKAEVISNLTDVFWLKEEEIEACLAALDQDHPLESMQEVVSLRRKTIRAERKVVPPTQLPYSKTYMGMPVEMFLPTAEGAQEGGRVKGIGASGGKVTGVACVLHGPEDFDQMQQGGILVAKLTTPAWTPLFAMASGVVTDIGGPLSHGSIVAREYGIPAVLGTGVATRLIASGQTITVDGTQGIITLGEVENR